MDARYEYALVDSGDEKRLERFGNMLVIRPCAQAVWKPKQPHLWKKADASFSRDEKNEWKFHSRFPSEWVTYLKDLKFILTPTDFGHVGVFPEHHHLWDWMEKQIQMKKAPRILNLFAYTGAATIKLSKLGAKVTHVDASKKSVNWACQNAELNGEKQNIRWIVDDAAKFIQREIKRGALYEGIILDPPSFGKGTHGEIFKIEKDIIPLLELCRKLLSPQPSFVVFTCHTPGFTPSVMRYLLESLVPKQGRIEAGEMLIESAESFALPSGVFARWSSHD